MTPLRLVSERRAGGVWRKDFFLGHPVDQTAPERSHFKLTRRERPGKDLEGKAICLPRFADLVEPKLS
ncbi:hypothetical protein L596_029727 [Steinernema carpocapsae]|uniref:Uncharacterized protein n=1 Tax=Steinernema carpocapsae TaxID=34508 RepID=A0A4U5LQM7_STECR|nr:hypothetical protein L596_029727 [Steinernema carpocapsae]